MTSPEQDSNYEERPRRSPEFSLLTKLIQISYKLGNPDTPLDFNESRLLDELEYMLGHSMTFPPMPERRIESDEV